MTEERLVLAELLEKAGEGDFLRAVAEGVLQLLMETDVEGLIGAGRYERSGRCSGSRSNVITVSEYEDRFRISSSSLPIAVFPSSPSPLRRKGRSLGSSAIMNIT